MAPWWLSEVSDTMWRPSYRTAGPLLGLSALCLLIAAVPLAVWPEPQPGDSYVFAPPLFSAIWMQRIAQPFLTVSANVLVIVGLGALFKRDGTSLSNLRSVSGLVTVFGTSIILFGSLLVTTAGLDEIMSYVLGLLAQAIGLVLTLPGLVGWGAGYLRADNMRLGIALAGAPLLTCAYLGVSLLGVQFTPIADLLLITPTSAMALVVGYDLWADSASSSAAHHQSKS